MEQKSPLSENQQPHTPSNQSTLQEESTRFKNKVKYFLNLHAPLHPQLIQYGRRGHGFALRTKNNQKEIDQLIEQTFSMNLQQFLREARRLGFTVRRSNPVKSIGESIILLSKQKIFDEKEVLPSLEMVSISEESDLQEQEDDFPKEQEVQSIMKHKEEKGRVNVVKRPIILNKVMSQGDSALPDWKKNEDASIQVKLQEQDYLSHFFSTHKKQSNKYANPEGAQNGNALVDRSLSEKQNYEKCSKMIDSTIIEFLEAHRSNKISQKKEHLMNNIAEIYDMLSNSIENIAVVSQLFGARQSTIKRQEPSQVNMPSGFKSISEV